VFHYDWHDHVVTAAQDTPDTVSMPMDTDNPAESDPPTQRDDARTYRALFTVSERIRYTTRRSRAIVRFVGRAIQSPDAWSCQRCLRDERCPHILEAQQRLRDLVLAPEEAEGEQPFVARQFYPLLEFKQLQPQLERHGERCVSRFPRRAVPIGQAREQRVMLDIDYSAIRLLRCSRIPGPLDHDERPSCRCGGEAEDMSSVEVRDCIVYDMDRAYATKIETFRCAACNTYGAGPDLGDKDLFNFDNKTIVTHRLLHKYDAYFSQQEGTFAAFAGLLNYEYDAKFSVPDTFMHVDVFRTVWFSFVRLQQFADNMFCPICRHHPGAIIADGVTIATRVDKSTGNIQPPTIPDADSPIRDAVRPAARGGGTQLVPNRQLRKRCVDLIDCVSHKDTPHRRRQKRKLVAHTKDNWELVPDSDAGEDELDEVLAYVDLLHARPQRRPAAEPDRPHEDLVKATAKALTEHDNRLECLADAFRVFVLSAGANAWRSSWLRLLKQVCHARTADRVFF